MTYQLRAPATEPEWSVYHEIRRVVLFERRGRGDYDPTRPEESRPGHHPMILLRDQDPLGVIRIDIDGPTAFFRRVAIREDAQRRGHGREMLARAERFAAGHGCVRIDSHVDADAVGFYERCGYERVQHETPHAATVLMTKAL